MDRRSFLGSILALAAAPAVVRAESIMRVRPIVLPGDEEYELFTGEVGRYENFRFISSADIHAAVKLMKNNHIPPNKNGKYVAFVHPSFLSHLR